MKRLLIALAAALCVSCSQPAPAARRCPTLPEPSGTTIAAVRAYALVVVQLYAQCASTP